MSNEYLRKLFMLAMFAVMALACPAQLLRTSYFMESAHYRLQLNPALAPSRGYVHIPAVGNIGASYYSNGFGLHDVIDIISNKDDADYFVSNKFMSRLKDNNHAMASANTDIIAAGWWHGMSFMSVNVGVKVNGSLKAPMSLFSFMRDMRGMNSNDYSNYVRSIGKEEIDLTAYGEIGFGYSRQLNDRLSLGGKIKALLGLGNMHLNVKDVTVRTNLQGLPANYNWTYGDPTVVLEAQGTASIDVDADLESSVEGLNLLTHDKDYIDELEFDTKHMGVAGFGAAIDAGVSYKVTNELTLSAAITDLGFIRWAKGCTQVYHSNSSDLHFDSESMGDLSRFASIIGSTKPISIDILRLKSDNQQSKARTTQVASTITGGADYAFNGDKVRLGILYSHHQAAIQPQDEVTLSVNYHPSRWVDLAVSYSPVMCGGKSAGLAVKAGPLFVGTDYIYMGKNTKCCNVLAGISIPLGEKPHPQQPSQE